MLIRFGVSNHRSIRDYQELSFVSSKTHDDLPHALPVDIPGISSNMLLPVIALYGANAAGKSNLLDALTFFDLTIFNSYSRGQNSTALSQHAFCLDEGSSTQESVYDCDVIIAGVRYTYGFALTEQKITREWLYSFPKGARNIMFQREFSEETMIYFGPSIKKITQPWRKLSEDNQALLLSAAGQKEHFHEQLTPVFEYFRNRFRTVSISSDESREWRLADLIERDSTADKLAAALKSADVGIKGIRIKDVPFDDAYKKIAVTLQGLLKELEPSRQSTAFDDHTSRKSIEFIYSTADGKEYVLSYGQQSSGTRYLLSLLVPVISALETGKTLIVDEITTNLHTKLSEKIIELFTSPTLNPKGAQFVFSTHDTNLLSRELLRRDEIWFAEKDREGATTIYPLTDFKTRKLDNLEKGYLQGRFGAIPFIGNISVLLG